MEIFGYVGYAALLILAVTWTIGVRTKLDAGVNTILGALFFVVGATWLSTSNADKLHSLWLIPSGFIFAVVTAFLVVRIPPLLALLQPISSLFAAVVRVGISAERIRAAQATGLKTSVEEWASKQNKKK